MRRLLATSGTRQLCVTDCRLPGYARPGMLATMGLVQGSTGRLFHLVQDLIVAAGQRRRTLIIRSTCDGYFLYHNAILIRR